MHSYYLGRPVLIQSMQDPLVVDQVEAEKGFVAMVPAFLLDGEKSSQQLIRCLLERGCAEFCCVGPQAEKMHDAIDEMIEDLGLFHVVTTWYEDLPEACDYFLNAANGGEGLLLGLVKDCQQIIKILIPQLKGGVSP